MKSTIKDGKMKSNVDRLLEKRVTGIEQLMVLTNRRV
jgi:hypothetical protein